MMTKIWVHVTHVWLTRMAEVAVAVDVMNHRVRVGCGDHILPNVVAHSAKLDIGIQGIQPRFPSTGDVLSEVVRPTRAAIPGMPGDLKRSGSSSVWGAAGQEKQRKSPVNRRSLTNEYCTSETRTEDVRYISPIITNDRCCSWTTINSLEDYLRCGCAVLWTLDRVVTVLIAIEG